MQIRMNHNTHAPKVLCTKVYDSTQFLWVRLTDVYYSVQRDLICCNLREHLTPGRENELFEMFMWLTAIISHSIGKYFTKTYF